MSGMSTKKLAREVFRKCGADQMIPIRSNRHQMFEFRRKGLDRGFVYTLAVSASCPMAAMKAAKDIRKGLDSIAREQRAMA